MSVCFFIATVASTLATPTLAAQLVKGPYLLHFQKTRQRWDKHVAKLGHRSEVKAILDKFETLFSGYDKLGLLGIAEKVKGVNTEAPVYWQPWSSDPVLQAFEHPIQGSWGPSTMLIMDKLVSSGAPVEKLKDVYNQSVTSIAERFKILDIEVPALLE